MRIKKRMAVYMASSVAAAVLVVPGAMFLGSQSGAVASTSAARVAPHIFVQANHLTGRVIKNGTGHHDIKVGAFSDGCDHAYGTVNQCVPLKAPDNKPVTCTYLKQEGYLKQGLLVHHDRLHLVKAGRTTKSSKGLLLTSC